MTRLLELFLSRPHLAVLWTIFFLPNNTCQLYITTKNEAPTSFTVIRLEGVVSVMEIMIIREFNAISVSLTSVNLSTQEGDQSQGAMWPHRGGSVIWSLVYCTLIESWLSYLMTKTPFTRERLRLRTVCVFKKVFRSHAFGSINVSVHTRPLETLETL